MPYADTDFFVALAMQTDRHHAKALELYEEHRGNIKTSIVTMIELALVSKKTNRRVDEVIEGALATADIIDCDRIRVLSAAHLIERKGVGVFDAFHAVLCDNEIISSDHIYDELGIKKIQL